MDYTDEDIYQQFPRKVAKADALRAIKKAVGRLAKTMGDRLARQNLYAWTLKYSLSPEGRRPDREFIPYPASFYNSERYLDDPKEWGCREHKPAASPVKAQIPQKWVLDYWQVKKDSGRPEFKDCPEDIKELLG